MAKKKTKAQALKEARAEYTAKYFMEDMEANREALINIRDNEPSNDVKVKAIIALSKMVGGFQTGTPKAEPKVSPHGESKENIEKEKKLTAKELEEIERLRTA
jgi:hypothetical protein